MQLVPDPPTLVCHSFLKTMAQSSRNGPLPGMRPGLVTILRCKVGVVIVLLFILPLSTSTLGEVGGGGQSWVIVLPFI